MPTIPWAASRLQYLRIRHLRFLQLLDELGSLAAVAEQLSLSPSAASMMLKEIEQLVGVKLFVRAGRGMAATEYARMILPRCRTMLGEAQALHSSLQSPAAPVLRLGTIPHTAATVLPKVIEKLTLGKPAWRMKLREAHVDSLLQLLLDSEIDLMLGRIPRTLHDADTLAGLSQRLLYQSTLSIVCGKQNPLCKAETLTLQDIRQSRWILPTADSMARIAFAESFLQAGLSPPVPVVEAPSVFYSIAAVSETELLTCCPRHIAMMSAGSTHILPVELGVKPAAVALVWRRDSEEACMAIKQLETLSVLL